MQLHLNLMLEALRTIFMHIKNMSNLERKKKAEKTKKYTKNKIVSSKSAKFEQKEG